MLLRLHPFFYFGRATLLGATLCMSLCLAACGQDEPAPPTTNQAATKPKSAVKKPAKETATNVPELYTSVCMACHDAGVAQAPKLGNQTEWSTRADKGEAALMRSIIQGKEAMPVKGTALHATDEELREVLHYILQSAK